MSPPPPTCIGTHVPAAPPALLSSSPDENSPSPTSRHDTSELDTPDNKLAVGTSPASSDPDLGTTSDSSPLPLTMSNRPDVQPPLSTPPKPPPPPPLPPPPPPPPKTTTPNADSNANTPRGPVRGALPVPSDPVLPSSEHPDARVHGRWNSLTSSMPRSSSVPMIPENEHPAQYNQSQRPEPSTNLTFALWKDPSSSSAPLRPRSLSLVRAVEISRIASEAVADLPDGFIFHADFSGNDARVELQSRVEQRLIRSLREAAASSHPNSHALTPPIYPSPCFPTGKLNYASLLFQALPFAAEGVSDIVDDQFNQCFEADPPRPWNWGYLYPIWLIGVLVRHCILFPLRACVIGLACLTLFLYFAVLRIFRLATRERECASMTLFAKALMLAFGAVVSYHGVRPRNRCGQVYVANHTTMMDFVLLLGLHPFSVVGQLHSGVVGWFQRNVFSCLQCLWFDRKNADDRAHIREMIQKHVADPTVPPLVIFPEGTCVNNKFLVQFKKGAFELDDVDVYPVAIKYNQEWAVAFWDSRRESFVSYLIGIMMSWAVVVDIWFLPPERRRSEESPVAFAERVKSIIARRAGLTPVPYDGYLKHIRPSERYVSERRRETAQWLLSCFSESLSEPSEPPPEAQAGRNGIRKRL